jgi:Tfp pilus assembly protein PilN
VGRVPLVSPGYDRGEGHPTDDDTEMEDVMENADHAMGLELQLVELVEQQTRAQVQHRDEDAALLEPEIVQLRGELAEIGDLAVP